MLRRSARCLPVEQILFGGSFEPFHLGHAEIVRELYRRFPKARIAVVPNRLSPLKRIARQELVHKVQMLEDALEFLESGLLGEGGIRPPRRLSLETFELEREGPSYTIDTILHFYEMTRIPKKHLALAMGRDSFSGLRRWKSWERLADLCVFIVFERGIPSENPIPAELERLADYCVIPFGNSVSADAVRAAVRAEEPIRSYLLSCTADYIEGHRLYRDKNAFACSE